MNPEDGRLNADFQEFWDEIRFAWLGHTHIQEDVVKRIYESGWYDGGKAMLAIFRIAQEQAPTSVDELLGILEAQYQ